MRNAECGIFVFYSALRIPHSKKMAEINDKLPENARGKFYVDKMCIDCDVCRDTSPKNFTRDDENGYSYVYRQPESPEEYELCEEALLACPVEAIGDDGN